jgi:hypothetical protein
MPSIPVLRALPVALLIACLGAAAASAAGSPGYDVFIEPGLTAELPVSRVVPELPAPLGGGRIAGTIRSIQRVALVRGQNTPSIHPELSRETDDVPVWVVLCRGEFRASGPYDLSSRGTRAFFYVHHESGMQYGWGLLGADAE